MLDRSPHPPASQAHPPNVEGVRRIIKYYQNYKYSLDKTISLVYNAGVDYNYSMKDRCFTMKEKKEKLNNSQMKVMQILWEEGTSTAKNLCLLATERYGWNKNTTYTIIKSLVEAEIIERSEPDFLCKPLLSLEEVRKSETKSFLDKFYKGSAGAFFSAFLEEENLSPEELSVLKKLISEKK